MRRGGFMQKPRKILFFAFLYFLLLACSAAQFQNPEKPTEKPSSTVVVDVGKQKFSTSGVSFEYPCSWRTMEEIFGKPAGKTREPEFDADILVTVTNAIPSPFGEKYTAWCTLMTRSTIKGQNLLSQVNGAYSILKNYPDSEISLQKINVNGNFMVEKIYRRPRGEPWYQVRDIWTEKDNIVFILSCYSNPSDFDKNTNIFTGILKSMTFK
jgi:hypothetical protein